MLWLFQMETDAAADIHVSEEQEGGEKGVDSGTTHDAVENSSSNSNQGNKANNTKSSCGARDAVEEKIHEAPAAASAAAQSVADPPVGGEGSAKNTPASVVCCEVDREAFANILLTPTMIASHLPDQYVAAVSEI